MRGKTKLVSLAAILTIMLTVSMVFASGILDVSKLTLFSEPPVTPESPGTAIAVEPGKIVKDYNNDPDYQIDNTFTIILNITEAADLYT